MFTRIVFLAVLFVYFDLAFIKPNSKRQPIVPCNNITVCEPNGDGEVCYPTDPDPPCFE